MARAITTLAGTESPFPGSHLLPVSFHCAPGPVPFTPPGALPRGDPPPHFPEGESEPLLSCLQVLWLPNRQRPLVRKVAPGFQQTSGSKEAAATLRKGHIQGLNLRYTQVSRQELRCQPHLAQTRPDE